MLTAENIARICHEANRAYCMTIGDHSQPTWDMAPQWQRDSAIAGVLSALPDPAKTPEQLHAEWMEAKLESGWKYGPIKRPEALEHPCIVLYDKLPVEQKAKDGIFLAIVSALRSHVAPGVVPTKESPPVPATKAADDNEEAVIPKEAAPKKSKRKG